MNNYSFVIKNNKIIKPHISKKEVESVMMKYGYKNWDDDKDVYSKKIFTIKYQRKLYGFELHSKAYNRRHVQELIDIANEFGEGYRLVGEHKESYLTSDIQYFDDDDFLTMTRFRPYIVLKLSTLFFIACMVFIISIFYFFGRVFIYGM